jgi:hypothetical protein
VRREVVEHDHQVATRPVPAQSLEEREKLATATLPAHVKDDPARANIEAGENGERPVATIDILDSLRSLRRQRAAGMQSLEDLHLRLFVDADDARAAGERRTFASCQTKRLPVAFLHGPQGISSVRHPGRTSGTRH